MFTGFREAANELHNGIAGEYFVVNIHQERLSSGVNACLLSVIFVHIHLALLTTV